MIQNYDEVRKQLASLAEVINAYKSEAVQLRLVELVFGVGPENAPAASANGSGGQEAATSTPSRRKGRRRASPKPRQDGSHDTDATAEPKVRAARTGGSRKGSVATLADLYAKGFFKTKRTIGQLVEHCDQNLALKFKSSDFSGTLARYVRDEKLKRAKNADGQYEYTQGG